MQATLNFSWIFAFSSRGPENPRNDLAPQEGVLFLVAQRSSRLLFRLLQGAGGLVSRIAESPLTTSLTKF
jgi:hypothetical protein